MHGWPEEAHFLSVLQTLVLSECWNKSACFIWFWTLYKLNGKVLLLGQPKSQRVDFQLGCLLVPVFQDKRQQHMQKHRKLIFQLTMTPSVHLKRGAAGGGELCTCKHTKHTHTPKEKPGSSKRAGETKLSYLKKRAQHIQEGKTSEQTRNPQKCSCLLTRQSS